MLFLLTGSVQSGKTRWLERLAADAEAAGAECCGVLAPGVWREREGGFEKLGIDNVLLPSGERFAFARRRDLAQAEGLWRADSQSARAQLGWEMSDDAIAQVNAHFAALARGGGEAARPALLVVDELGPLELVRGGGLTEALACAAAGPSARFPHALVVVREALLDAAHARFDAPWGIVREIAPDDASRAAVFDALLG